MSGRYIIHVDMDAFFAAVEVRDNPALAGKPLIIGALPHERGVVSTCSYEARKYGVRSAMNIKEAYARCPHGIFMHGNMKKYAEASGKIHEIMLKYTDMIEFVALDEGYMDVTGSIRLFGSAENIGRRLKKEIYDAVGVTCSVGVSYSMMSAKLASEEKKPDGFFVIPDKESLIRLIENRPVGIINGIGRKTAQRLEKIGIVTVRNLIDAPKEVFSSFGAVGEEIQKLASGEDDRVIVPESEAKSIGREHTFQSDISDAAQLKDALFLLAGDVSFRAKRMGVWAKCVTLKLKFSDMKGITRSRSGEAVNSARDIYSCAAELFDGVKRTNAVRLIGVSISHLQTERGGESAQISLFDDEKSASELHKEKSNALSDTVFELHSRFGRGIVRTGKELEIMKNMEKLR